MNFTKKTNKSIFAFIKNIPIATKLFICFSFVFIIMIILYFITDMNYKTDKEKSTISVIEQMNSQTINKIDDYIIDIINLTKIPLYKDIWTSSQYINLLDEFNDTNIRSLELQKETEQLFNLILNYKEPIQSIFIFNTNGIYESIIRNKDIYFTDYNPKDEIWFENCLSISGSPLVVSTFKLPDSSLFNFSVARAIVKVDGHKTIGLITINTEIAFLEKLCNKMLIIPNQKITIIDSKNNIVYDKSFSKIGKKYNIDFLPYINKNNETKKIKIDNIDYLISYQQFKNTDWKIINTIPLNELNKNIDKTRKTNLITAMSLAIIAFIFVLLFSLQISRPIKKLVVLMKLVEKGNFDVKINVTSKDEIGQLSITFNHMTQKIKRLINEVYIDKIKQQDLEMQLLQNQINPHFIYNTLESIHMMAEINSDEETSKMTLALADFLRYSISKVDEIVTVKEEIRRLNDYILLQHIRFEDMFSITSNIEKDILPLPIIKLILQPIVENSIYHGLNNTVKEGKIEIEGFIEGSNIIFTIKDNGKGMTKEQVILLNEYVHGFNDSFSSIGLKNVNKRIQLHYGKEYGLIISSIPNKGTTVKITISKRSFN